MQGLRKFHWWLRYIVALPFILIGNPLTWLVANAVWFYYGSADFFGMAFVYTTIVCWLFYLAAARLRPAPDRSRFNLPKQAKPLASPTVALTAKKGGSAPSLSAITRQLPKELQNAMKGPVDRQPEALVFENAQTRRKLAEKQEAAP